MKRRKPPKKIPNADPSGTEASPNGACRTCGKAARSIRCPKCHKEFELWASDPEPESTPEVYIPRNQWADDE